MHITAVPGAVFKFEHACVVAALANGLDDEKPYLKFFMNANLYQS